MRGWTFVVAGGVGEVGAVEETHCGSLGEWIFMRDVLDVEFDETRVKRLVADCCVDLNPAVNGRLAKDCCCSNDTN